MTKAMKCPVCGHLAALHQFPEELAGTWECPSCGASDSCEHPSRHVEQVTTDYMRNGEPDQYETDVYVCNDCYVTIYLDVADPALDAAEAGGQ